jgi:hypothetical protein
MALLFLRDLFYQEITCHSILQDNETFLMKDFHLLYVAIKSNTSYYFSKLRFGPREEANILPTSKLFTAMYTRKEES